METRSPNQHQGEKPRQFSLTAKIAFAGLLAAAGVYVVADRANLLAWLPFLVILACPLLHMFMHRGHGKHGSQPRQPSSPADRESSHTH